MSLTIQHLFLYHCSRNTNIGYRCPTMGVICRQTKGVTTLHPADPLFRSVSALIREYHASRWQNNDSRGYTSEVSIIKNPRNYTTHTQWGGVGWGLSFGLPPADISALRIERSSELYNTLVVYWSCRQTWFAYGWPMLAGTTPDKMGLHACNTPLSVGIHVNWFWVSPFTLPLPLRVPCL